MSYITSCLPLRGCRSLCTLESCNTPFPASLFLSSKWRQCLLSPSGSVRAFIYTNICIKHGGVTFSDAAQLFVGSAPQVSWGDSKLTLIPVLFTWHWFYFIFCKLGGKSQQNWNLPSLSYAVLELLQRRNRRIKLNAQFGQAFQWVTSLLRRWN